MENKFITQSHITGEDIRQFRKITGIDRKTLAALADVSPRTVEHWENGNGEVSGPIVFLRHMILENPGLIERLQIPAKESPLRLLYYYRNDLCTLIDVDERRQTVKIKNYTDRLQYRAFGLKEYPSYMEYLDFLKSRCFPETRDMVKLELKEIGVPYYDPLLIIEKTGGKMAEDHFHIEVLRND